MVTVLGIADCEYSALNSTSVSTFSPEDSRNLDKKHRSQCGGMLGSAFLWRWCAATLTASQQLWLPAQGQASQSASQQDRGGSKGATTSCGLRQLMAAGEVRQFFSGGVATCELMLPQPHACRHHKLDSGFKKKKKSWARWHTPWISTETGSSLGSSKPP